MLNIGNIPNLTDILVANSDAIGAVTRLGSLSVRPCDLTLSAFAHFHMLFLYGVYVSAGRQAALSMSAAADNDGA